MATAKRLRRMAGGLLALGACTFAADPAFASGRCGLTTVAGGVADLSYDPFSGSTTTIQLTNITLSRVNGPTGEKTQTLTFFVKGQSADQDGTQIKVISASGSGSGDGYNQNVFVDFGATGPVLTNTNSAPTGAFFWNFGGNDPRSDTFTAQLQIVLPPNLNLTAGNALPFNIVYSCTGTGAKQEGNFTSTGDYPNAITANVRTLNALQASYAGTDLTFGEIGTVTDAQASTRKTAANNYIRVRSSGPYKVTLTSANAYRMTFAGGNLNNTAQRIPYSLDFLGQNSDTTATITRNCSKAGVPGPYPAAEDRLYLQATLKEGGFGKAVSPAYQDILTVLIEPKIIPDPLVDCSALFIP